MKRMWAVLAAVILIVVPLAGCSSNAMNIEVPEEVRLDKGNTESVLSYFSFAEELSQEELLDAVDKLQPEYQSDDETVAYINENHELVAVGGGQTMLTIKVGKQQVECMVTVTVPAESITAEENLVPVLGDEEVVNVNAVVLPEDTTDQIVYTSSDDAVAMVDEEGNIVPVGLGECEIEITAGDQVFVTSVIVADSQENSAAIRSNGFGSGRDGDSKDKDTDNNSSSNGAGDSSGTDPGYGYQDNPKTDPRCSEAGHTKMGMCQICFNWIRCDNKTGPGHTEVGNCSLCHSTISRCKGPGHWENGTCPGCGSVKNCDMNGVAHNPDIPGQCPTCGLINSGYYEIGEGGGAPGIGWDD